MALSTLDLDLLVTGGCGIPNCGHDHHGETFLHGQCHPHARVRVGVSPGMIHVVCAQCFMLITQVGVLGTPKPIENNCHPGTGLDVQYKLGSGKLNIMCSECQKVLRTERVTKL